MEEKQFLPFIVSNPKFDTEYVILIKLAEELGAISKIVK